MIYFIYIVNYFILIYFVISAIIYTILLIFASPLIVNFFFRAKYTNVCSLLKSKVLPPVTVLTPMYNETFRIRESVLSVLNSDYTNLYVILINDASTDSTVEFLRDEFDMVEKPLIFPQTIKTSPVKAIYISRKYPRLMLIDKEHGGAGDSLNVGINACFTPYFATIDADTTIDKLAMSELMFELLAEPYAVGIGGAVYVRNGCEFKDGIMIQSKLPYQMVPALQANEYLRSHLFNRTGWNKFGSTMSYSGTATIFNTAAVRAVGGFDIHNFAQDADIIMRLHIDLHNKKQKYQILFNPSALVWTDVPGTLKSFAIQRDKWQRGLLRSVINNKRLFFNAKYKIQGLLSYPVFIFLEILAPIVEFTAYIFLPLSYYLGILDGTSAILYMLLAWGFPAYLTMVNAFINVITFGCYQKMSDVFWVCLLAIIEMFGFRQYLTLVKMYGTFRYIINRIRGKPL